MKDARRASRARLRNWLVTSLVVCAIGCGGPEGVAPPDWEPESMADAAMELNDKNKDDVLDAKELAAAPGLKAAAEAEAGSADLDGDGRLTRDEVRDRIAFYQETKLGIEMAGMEFYVGDTQPLAGATIELVPEPFLEGTLDIAKATTRDNGFALPTVEGEALEGVRPGMYRVKITSPSVRIPDKYTKVETTPLGVEIITSREGYSSGKRIFKLDKS